MRAVADDVVLPAGLEPSCFKDPELVGLANALPGILVQDNAEKTINTYLGVYRRWKQWAIQRGMVPLPAETAPFALYLVYLIQQERSVAAVNSIVYGVSWVHKKGGFPEPAQHPLVKQ